MPRFTKESDGRTLTVETAVPTEAAELRAQGWHETKAKTAEVKAADSKTESK